MPREIIQVQVGQCGNQIGTKFWQTIIAEHKLNVHNGRYTGDKNQTATYLDKIDVYFRQNGNKFIPRACCIDLEPGTIDIVRHSSIGSLFKPDKFIVGASGAGNNWAKGHYTEGAELIEQALDVIRREMESCESPQGFQICHSLGGGTGSGMGTLILLKLRDNYPDRILSTFSVYPSPKVSDTVVEPYNAVLSSHQLLENADQTFIIDNEALYNICYNNLKKNAPTYSELNNLISMVMSGITASLRFPAKLNGNLRKLGVNLVPFPRLHFFLVSQAPLYLPKTAQNTVVQVKELIKEAMSPRNFFSNVRPEDGKYLTASWIFRGNMKEQGVDDQVNEYQMQHNDDNVEWIPNNIKSSIIDVPPQGTQTSATFIQNTTSLKGIFQRLVTQFGAMYKRKAFLHWYKGEGMDEMEFQEADRNVRDLITEYQDKQDAVINPGDYE